MAAGEMVARAAGTSLDAIFREAIARPCGAAVGFRPEAESAARAAATENGQEFERELAGAEGQGYRGFREGRIRGEVHDHHAWIAGGVLGSAGLFADAAALDALARELLEPRALRIPGDARERLTGRREDVRGEPRSEGFILNLGGDSSGGPSLERGAFGHTGFTGTSLWIEPGRGRLYILLTNRIHPRVRHVDMLAFRQGFHRVAAALPAGR
jgi:CubicO group peptidase (beta-lactamase class C family)